MYNTFLRIRLYHAVVSSSEPSLIPSKEPSLIPSTKEPTNNPMLSRKVFSLDDDPGNESSTVLDKVGDFVCVGTVTTTVRSVITSPSGTIRLDVIQESSDKQTDDATVECSWVGLLRDTEGLECHSEEVSGVSKRVSGFSVGVSGVSTGVSGVSEGVSGVCSPQWQIAITAYRTAGDEPEPFLPSQSANRPCELAGRAAADRFCMLKVGVIWRGVGGSA